STTLRKSVAPPGGESHIISVCLLCRYPHKSHQRVARTADGEQALRVPRVVLELAPEVRDVDVGRPLVADVRALPEVLHDLAAAVDPLRLLREEGQQPELRARQVDCLAA